MSIVPFGRVMNSVDWITLSSFIDLVSGPAETNISDDKKEWLNQ